MTDTITGRGTEDGAEPDREPPQPAEQRAALVRLLVVLAALAALTVATDTWKTVTVVVAVIVMIMLHELGHYLTARWGGMKVTEFFVGFGPRLWSVRKGDTEYGVKALPVGGYVKIIGMNNLDKIEDPADEPRTYRQRPFPQRLAVAVAGSTMHFIIAFLLFFVINTVVGVPAPTMKIAELVALPGGTTSPALESGLRVGDTILSIDGNRFTEWADAREYIADRPDQPLAIVVDRSGERRTVAATPIDLIEVEINGRVAAEESRGFLGLQAGSEWRRINPITALGRSAKQWVGGDFKSIEEDVSPGLIDNAKALASIGSPAGASSLWRNITGGEDGQGDPEGVRFLSPVGFVRVAGQAAENSLFDVLALLIAINLFVGIFNLLPLLPLDGGHVAIAVYEAVRSKLTGRRHMADVEKLLPLTYVVFLLIVFLGVSALYLDIVRPLNFR